MEGTFGGSTRLRQDPLVLQANDSSVTQALREPVPLLAIDDTSQKGRIGANAGGNRYPEAGIDASARG